MVPVKAHDLANLGKFGIAASKPLGVSMKNIQVVAKGVGRDHALADALWKTGVYEARMLAAFVDVRCLPVWRVTTSPPPTPNSPAAFV